MKIKPLRELSIFCQHFGSSAPLVRQKKDGSYQCLGCYKTIYDYQKYEPEEKPNDQPDSVQAY